MQTQNKLLDDLARVASSAMGVAAGVREEMEGRLRDQFARVLDRMDLVSREEFEAVKAVAVKAREEQEILTERLATLELKLAGKKPAGAKKSTKKRSPKAPPPAG